MWQFVASIGAGLLMDEINKRNQESIIKKQKEAALDIQSRVEDKQNVGGTFHERMIGRVAV
jgi:hypothetical protein